MFVKLLLSDWYTGGSHRTNLTFKEYYIKEDFSYNVRYTLFDYITKSTVKVATPLILVRHIAKVIG